jgi:hypothetical protein
MRMPAVRSAFAAAAMSTTALMLVGYAGAMDRKDGFGAVGWKKLDAETTEQVRVPAATASFGIEFLAAKFFPEEVRVRRIG